MVITFSNIKGSGGGGATGGTVSGITLWSSDYTQEYIDNALSGVTDALSAYTPTSGFSTINGSAITTGDNLVIEGTPYSGGTNIDITDHVISVTGITVPTKVSDLENDEGFITSGAIPTSNTAFTNDAGYITSGDAQTQIDDAVSGKMDTAAMSAYTPTSGFSTINGSAITEGGNITVEATPYSAGTGIGISEHVISVTGDYETVVELTQAEYDVLTAYSENTTYIITDAPAINMSAYTPTSGFSTINGSAITTGEAIVIEETPYSAGTNINIANHVISVTGITVPTKVSDLTNDAGYITTADTKDFVTSGDVKTQVEAYNYVDSGDVKTQIEDYGYITEDALSGYSTTEEMNAAITAATDGLASTTYVDNAVSGKQDTLVNQVNIKSINGTSLLGSGNIQISEGGTYTGGDNIEITAQNVIKVTGITSYTGITSGDVVTALGYTPISGVDLSEYYTSAQTNTAISNAVSGKADSSRVDEIEEVTASALTDLNNRMITTGTVQSMITAATDGLASTTYVDNAVSGKQDTSAMTAYYTSAQTNTAINNATSGKASITYVNNAVSGKMDTSAMTAYATTGSVIDVENHIDEVEEVVASALTDLHTTKQDTLVSGTNIKTINNESILGSGNITIQGGGGANIIELTQAQYDALTAYTEDAIYVITDAPVYDISNYELLSNKVTSISSASTDTQYPSAKCVYDLIGDVETLLASI